MSSIRIESAGRSWDFDQAPSSGAISIGREVDSDVELTEATVSRHHAELRPVGDDWELVDLGSSHGTWSGSERVTTVPVAGRVEVRLGGSQAPAVVLTTGVATGDAPATQFAPGAGAPAAAVPPPPPVPPAAAPVPPPYDPAARPGSAPGSPVNAPAAELDMTIVPSAGHPGIPGAGGPGLLVRSSVGDQRFPGGAPVRIGREPHLEVVTQDSAVSRQHAVIEPRPDGWWYVDRSRGGSFIDGERVTNRAITGPTEIVLGHPTAGFEIEVVPMVDAASAARSAQQAAKGKRGKGGVAAVIVAVLALVVAVGAVGYFGFIKDDDNGGGTPPTAGGDDGGLTTAELDRAKAASVQLLITDANDQVYASGSGSIISSDGLILTNAHVAQPSAPGQGGTESDDPAYLLVALTSPEDDAPVTPEYRAKAIVTDGYLDASVVQIYADADGNELDPSTLDLPEPMPIGNSDDLRTGDTITALGFPAIAQIDDASEQNPSLTVTRGVVSTFRADDVIGSVNPDEGNRAQIDSDIRIGSGNSGGASINDAGELVGINSAVFSYADNDSGAASGGTAIILPVDLTQDIRDIAADGGDPSYVSPYVDSMPTAPGDLPADATVTPSGWSASGKAGCSDGTDSIDSPKVGDTIYAFYDVTGVPDGTSISFDFTTLDGGTDLGQFDDVWKFGEDETCILAPFTVADKVDGVLGTMSLDSQPAAQNPVEFTK